MAEVLLYTDRAEAAIQLLQKAMRLDPGFPYSYQILMAQARFEQKRYRDVIDLLTTVCEGAAAASYVLPCQYYSASAYGYLGEIETGEKVLRLSTFHAPKDQFLQSAEVVIAIWFPFRNVASREHLLEGIRKVLQKY